MELTDAHKKLARDAWDTALRTCHRECVSAAKAQECVVYAVFAAGLREAGTPEEIPALLKRSDG